MPSVKGKLFGLAPSPWGRKEQTKPERPKPETAEQSWEAAFSSEDTKTFRAEQLGTFVANPPGLPPFTVTVEHIANEKGEHTAYVRRTEHDALVCQLQDAFANQGGTRDGLLLRLIAKVKGIPVPSIDLTTEGHTLDGMLSALADDHQAITDALAAAPVVLPPPVVIPAPVTEPLPVVEPVPNQQPASQ